jgi:2-polyprenyl-3-methyl-5-hydroxy-6-metoxy-1,4-benzoquinol methylase
MKLPERNKIKSQEMLEVFKFDLLEFFNQDDRFQNRYWYMTKFNSIINFVKSILAEQKECRILDLGCAQGNYSLTLSKRYEVIGVDIRSHFIKYAMLKKEPLEDAIFLCTDAEGLPFKNDSFDLVICSEVIEHVGDPQKVIKEIRRILKSSGNLIITTPNGNCLLFIFHKTFENFLRIPANERKRMLYSTLGHLFLFREKEIESLLANCGFRQSIKTRIYSLALGQSIPPAKLESVFHSRRILWFPKLFKFIPLSIFGRIEIRINSLPIIGSLLGRDLIYVFQKI